MTDIRNLIKPLSTIVVVLLLLGGGALAFNSMRGDDEKYRITAHFEKAIGLFENSDVNILGVPVGKVISVKPVGSRVEVVMEVDSEHKVPADGIAQIVPISVISDRYVQLAPVYTGGPFLQDGDVIEQDHTYIPAELDDVFKQLKKLLDAIEPGKEGEPGALGDLIVQLDKTLKNREDDLKNTLLTGSQLTETLADAQDDISGLLINLEDLFTQLASRANQFGGLNRNFALVMTALAQSRDDLTATLANLADMTNEVGRLVRTHGDRLGNDLGLAGRILTKVLENRASVEESLAWLPVVARGLVEAYHGGAIKAVDVRDNSNAKLECEFLNPLPPSPIKDELRRRCREQTGEPPGARPNRSAPEQPRLPSTEELEKLLPDLLDRLNCDEGVKKVRRQVRRLAAVGLPDDVKEELLRPLRKQLRQLRKECEELGRSIDDEGSVDGVGDLPLSDEPLNTTSNAGGYGVAAGTAPAPADEDDDSAWSSLTGWLSGFFGYLGVGS